MRSRDFRIFWIGQFISLVGTWMQNTVQPYVAYHLTGQPLYLGLIGFAGTLPTVFLTLPAGVLIERLDKRRVVLAMQAIMAAQALALAVLALTGALQIWHMLALALVLGMANAVEITARQSMMPDLVELTDLPNALALNAAGFNLARVAGPVLAAPFLLLVQDGGEGWAFMANALSYLIVIGSLFLLRPRPHRDVPVASQNHMQAFREGQMFIRNSQVVSLLVVLSGVIGFFGFTAAQQIPVFAHDVLGAPGDTEAIVASRNSLLVSALGVGALASSVQLSLFSKLRRKGLLMSIGHFVFGAAIMLAGLSRSFPLTLLAFALIGWGQVTALNLTNQIIQIIVPSSLRARVFSTYLWALQGATPFGSLAMGWVAQHYGSPTSALVAGAACFLTPLVIHLRTASLREFVDE
jgi:MFS family permease